MARHDEAAWRQFHHRYYDWLLMMASLRTNAPSEASELTQLTLLRVVRHIKTFKSEADFKNWLLCLMRCVIIDWSRQMKRRNLLSEKYQLWQLLRQGETEMPIRHGFADILGQLPDNDALLLQQKYIEGWSTRDLANKHNTSAKAIESKLARLRSHLRRIIEQSQRKENA